MVLQQRALSAAAVCAVLGAGLTACGSSAAPAAPAQPSDAASSAPASASAAPGPLDAMGAGEIAAKAVADLKNASSVHYSGQMKGADGAISFDVVRVGSTGCKEAMDQGGKGSFKVLAIGSTIWIDADRTFWETTNPALVRLAGKWIKTSPGGHLSSVTGMCHVEKQLSEASGAPGLQKGPVSTMAGQQVLQLSDTGDAASLYVTDTQTPEVVSLDSGGDGKMEFDHYNAPVSLTPPPASLTVSGKAYGL